MLNGNIIDDYSSMNSESVAEARKPVQVMSKIKQNKKARIDLESVHGPVADQIEEEDIEVTSSEEEEDIAGDINYDINNNGAIDFAANKPKKQYSGNNKGAK